MLGRLKLGTQFSLLLSLVFLVGMLVTGVTLWGIAQHEAEEDITTKAEILTQTMEAVRGYNSSHINPLLKDKLATAPEFIRETVPAFAAREIFEQFRDRPEYHSFFYKEAAPNPTNPRDQADEFETSLVEQFRQQPNLKNLSGYRATSDSTLFYIARPLAVQQSSCLQCHSKSSLAPKGLLTTYGGNGGFGWKLNDIVAAQVIYVPADEVFDHSRRNMVLMMGIFGSIFAIAGLLVNWLLKRRVIQPIKQLTAIARHVSSASVTAEQVGEFQSASITKVADRNDEPGQLARAFQHMAQEVADREQNLTQAVRHRTSDLAKSIKEAEKAKAEAERANSAKSQFLANMSHELRTPLNVILGFTQLLTRDRAVDGQQRGYLTTISRSGEHLLMLINNVLEMSKIEAGKATLHETSFDLYSLLDSLHLMLKLKAESKGLKLFFERSFNLPQSIRTDEGKLRQVLMNLLGNAIKFTQTGHVTLRVRHQTPDRPQTQSQSRPLTLLFEIEDTGPGIATHELGQLFEPFFQAESGRASQEGTGLGLPISQQFIRLMGGEITVSSEVGVGTIFKFEIQVQVTTTEKSPSHNLDCSVMELAPGQPTYRILIVEDMPENRQLLVELLTPVGFKVQTAINGTEAISIWKTWQPHLIWMDMRMPGMDGYETTRQIRALEVDKALGKKNPSAQSADLVASPPTTIIALTGSALEADQVRSLSSGCDDFVRKPFKAETIFHKMAEYLGVSYSYLEEPTAVSQQSSPKQTPLTPADMKVMPEAWIEQLHQAATRVNAKLLLQLIEEIPVQHSILAKELTALVNQFAFESIVDLTRHSLSSS